MLEQHFSAGHVTSSSGAVEGSLPVHISLVNIGTSLNKRFNAVAVAAVSSDVKWRSLIGVEAVDFCTVLQQCHHYIRVAVPAGEM